ncbi:MAG: RsmE family RNA methyltransferase, partial [Bacteroidota bacterium]
MSIFYQNPVLKTTNTLSQEESKHCAQVLRHTAGDEILVFDGQGCRYTGILTKVSKSACEFEVKSTEHFPKKPFSVHLAIAPTKNTDRMEWMVEKLCEIGVDQLTFLVTQHSERRKLRLDRMEKKVISAMKQSKNPFKLHIN